MLNWIIFGVCMFCLGVIVTAFASNASADGDIYVQDEDLYLNVNPKSLDKLLHTKKTAKFNIKRR